MPITSFEFETQFYAANGAYNVQEGGGLLDTYGYTPVENGVWIDPDTGFKAIAYQNGDSYILSFAGTEEGQDAAADLLSLGWGQWENNRNEILAFFQGLKDDNSNTNVSFVGHSLGGALAQYAAYEFVEEGVLTVDKVALTTFNGLGGVTALEQKKDLTFDSDKLNGAEIRHYYDPSDLVSQLSKHLGGPSSNYVLRSDNTPRFLVDAHLMKTIEESISDGTVQIDMQQDHHYFTLDDALPLLQKLGGGTNGLIDGNKFAVSPTEAFARIISFLVIFPRLETIDSGAKEEWDELRDWILHNAVTSYFELDPNSQEADMAVDAINYTLQKIGDKVPGISILGEAYIQLGAQAAALASEA